MAKPWSSQRFPKPRQCRISDDRIQPLRHLHLDGKDSPDGEPAAGPFPHEAPQSIQDLFQAPFEEDLIEDEALTEPVLMRSWYVHHRESSRMDTTSLF